MGVSLPHHMSREWIFRGVVVSSTLLLITSIIMIGLKSVPNEIWRSDRSKGGLRIEYAEGSLEVPSVPPRVFELLDPTAVGSAVACLIISLFGIIITFYSAKKGPVKTVFWVRAFVRATLIFIFLFTLAACLISFILHGVSAHFDPDSQRTIDKSPACETCALYTLDIVFPRPFDRETWACQVGSYNQFRNDGDYSLYGQFCVLSKAARWLSPFLVIFSAMVGLFFYLDWVHQRLLIRTWKSWGSTRHSKYSGSLDIDL